MKKHIIITIAREFGSGGHEIGERLSKAMGIPYYDEQIKDVARKNLGLSEYEVAQCEEVANRSLIYSIATGVSDIVSDQDGTNNRYRRLFEEEKRIILEYAEQGSCIIIGRCGNSILKGYSSCLNVFVQSSMVNRIQRISERYHAIPSEAKKMIEKKDKERTNFYARFGDGKWGDKSLYDLIINSNKAGIEGSVEVIKAFASQM